MKERGLLVVALISVSLLALELVWTRIFSAEFFYSYAFLVLSLAVLGLGLGALALRLFPVLDRDSLLGVHLALAGLMALAGPILVFRLGLDFSLLFSSIGMFVKNGNKIAFFDNLNAVYIFGWIGIRLSQFSPMGRRPEYFGVKHPRKPYVT